MADVFAASSGVAGLLSLCITVVGSIIQCYSAYKTLDSMTTRTTARLQSLLNVLKQVDETIRLPSFNDGDGWIVAQIHECVEECQEPFQELQSEYEKLQRHDTGNFKTKVNSTKTRVLYPFRSITLQKLDAEVGELRANLIVAVSILGLRSQDTLQGDLWRAEALLERIRSDQISDKIRRWRNAPDTYTDHSAALAQRHPGTGTWLIQSEAFQNWLSALHAACSGGCRNVVTVLLDAGADIHRTGGGVFGTVLATAVWTGDEQIVRTLLHHGADVNASTIGRLGSAVRMARHRGNKNIVQLLLDYGAAQRDIDTMGDNRSNSEHGSMENMYYSGSDLL